jgi:hypothetical protein
MLDEKKLQVDAADRADKMHLEEKKMQIDYIADKADRAAQARNNPKGNT